MVKVPVPLSKIMQNPYLSITTSPFTRDPEKMIIKRASFKKEEVPAHLRTYVIKPGKGNNPCTRDNGIEGTIVYKGRIIPKAALCLAYINGSEEVRAEIEASYDEDLINKFKELEKKLERGIEEEKK